MVIGNSGCRRFGPLAAESLRATTIRIAIGVLWWASSAASLLAAGDIDMRVGGRILDGVARTYGTERRRVCRAAGVNSGA